MAHLTAVRDALRIHIDVVRAEIEALRERQEQREAEEPTRDPDADARWLKGARRELAELIREIEGPRPKPAPRRKGG